jgi:WD40 repeat protein
MTEPRTIGGYEIQRVLGTGGMATVYAALQKQPRRTVALKVMRVTADTDRARRRFRREIEFLGRLRHPFIAQVYDAGVHEDESGPVPFFVMEYVPGAKTVIDHAAARDLALRDRVKLFVKICSAVGHGHQNKIIHRDLKPGNILIDENGEPKVIDFGVARAVDLDLSAQAARGPETADGSFVGTLQYMAPEQLETRPHDLDARCDVYALGMLLYRLVTGLPPYDLLGLPVFTAVQIVREDDPPRPGSIKAELKGDLERIILKALAKDRGQRYRSAVSLGRDLVRYLSSKPIKAREAGALYRARLFARRHRAGLRAGAVVLVVVAIAGTIIAYQQLALTRDRASAPEVPAAAAPGAGETAPTVPAVAPAPRPEPPSGPSGPPPAMYTLAGRGPGVSALAFDATGRMLASATRRGGIERWDVETRTVAFATADHDAGIEFVGFAPGGVLASVADDGTVVLVDAATGSIREVVRHGCPGVHAMAHGRSGDLVAIGCDDLTLRVLAPGRGLVQTIRGTRGAFHAAAFGPDDRWIAGGTERGDVGVWEAGTGARVESPRGTLDDRVVALAFGPEADGAAGRLTAVSEAGTIVTWERGADGVRWSARPPVDARVGRVAAAGFDPAGAWLACASAGLVAVRDLASGTAPVPFEAPDGATVESVALGPDGRWCAIGAADGTIHVVPVPGRW